MKKMLSLLALVAFFALPATLEAQWNPRQFVGSVNGVVINGNGYARYLATTAKTLSSTPDGGVAIHAWARHAKIYINGGNVRYRTDGTNPTTTEGVLWTAPLVIIVKDDPAWLRNLRFISTVPASEVTIEYGW